MLSACLVLVVGVRHGSHTLAHRTYLTEAEEAGECDRSELAGCRCRLRPVSVYEVLGNPGHAPWRADHQRVGDDDGSHGVVGVARCLCMCGSPSLSFGFLRFASAATLPRSKGTTKDGKDELSASGWKTGGQRGLKAESLGG